MKSITRQGDRILLQLGRGEAALLSALPLQLASALRHRAAPKLSPDEKTDAELHQLLDAELAARRVERQTAFLRTLAAVPAAGGALPLSLDEAEQWLALLTDLRLALALRLGIQDDAWGQHINPRRPPTPEHALYFYLSGLQAGLLEHGFGVKM